MHLGKVPLVPRQAAQLMSSQVGFAMCLATGGLLMSKLAQPGWWLHLLQLLGMGPKLG
jgi:hypothetical protein